MISTKFRLVLVIMACAVSACRPTLNSAVPSGQEAYQTLERIRTEAIAPTSVLRPNDQIDVTVFQEPDLSIEGATIDQAGYISLPLVGQIHAAGLSTAELSREIEKSYAMSYLRDPRITVILTKPAPRIITVEGEVKTAGVFEVQEGYTLLTALALAGSPTETAKLDEVLVFRSMGGERYGGRFDLTDIRAGRMMDPAIMAGDTIVVGYSNVRGVYLDFLKTAPIIGAFARY